ncbi:MAG TPA: hypothetical protein VNO81_14815 [Candidatus Nitrosotenuis sp.]|jgi:hypothetical protein|nr:hypothetical protein [Candidatus Nitrosotenuis sp.]
MRKTLVLLFLAWALPALANSTSPSVRLRAAAESTPPSARLRALVAALPPVGQIASFADLGVAIRPDAPDPSAPGYVFAPPADLDNRSTDAPPFAGRYPGLHLMLPLKVVPGPVHSLFMSDQPEHIDDSLKRRDGSTGAVGVYARAALPGKAPIRVLVDHTDGTERPLRLLVLWVPDEDGVVTVRRRGEAASKDSVRAGMEAHVGQTRVLVEPRHQVWGGRPWALVDWLLQPGETLVVEDEFVSTVPGQLFCLALEARDPAPADLAALEALPVMHSIVWGEQAERLKKFIDPEKQPTRYRRILGAFQHARGRFPYPDRMAYALYQVGSWSEEAHPVQVYSLHEAIPGHDPTVPAATENRGNYGAYVGLKLRLRQLPPGCREVALVLLNTSGTHGGVYYVTDGWRQGVQTLLGPGSPPGPLRQDQAVTLWRGEVRPGDLLTLWTRPVSNFSVHRWFMLVPIPGD